MILRGHSPNTGIIGLILPEDGHKPVNYEIKMHLELCLYLLKGTGEKWHSSEPGLGEALEPSWCLLPFAVGEWGSAGDQGTPERL